MTAALWLHELGKGAFGYVDGGKFVEVLRCPGYLRGLAFDRDIACIGLSKPRDTESPGAKAFASMLVERGTEARCGILFFDLKKGSVIHSLRFGQGVDEIYDVAVLGYRDPLLISPDSPEASRTYIIGKLPPKAPAKTERKTDDQSCRKGSISNGSMPPASLRSGISICASGGAWTLNVASKRPVEA